MNDHFDGYIPNEQILHSFFYSYWLDVSFAGSAFDVILVYYFGDL